MKPAILCAARQTVLPTATKCGFDAPDAGGGREMAASGMPLT
jgi:hypothetical protein